MAKFQEDRYRDGRESVFGKHDANAAVNTAKLKVKINSMTEVHCREISGEFNHYTPYIGTGMAQAYANQRKIYINFENHCECPHRPYIARI